MCKAIPCDTCGKTTWAGCGRHIESVRASVPAARWCSGHKAEPASGGFFSRLFGGR